MSINLNEISVYIIEDEEDVATAIKDGLCLLIGESQTKFDPDKIKIKIIKDKNPDEIFRETKKDVLKFDVLFIDLHLGIGIDQGLDLIRQYMKDPLICHIPKYVITSDSTVTKTADNIDIVHYATVMAKPDDLLDKNKYAERFITYKITQALPLVVEIYGKIKENRTINDLATMLQDMNDKQIENQAEANAAIDVIHKLLEKIDTNIIDIKSQTVFIEHATLTMIQLLPDSLSKDSQVKAKEFIKLNIGAWIDIEENFFPNTKLSFISSLKSAVDDITSDTLKDGLKDGLKEVVKKVAQEQGISGDNLAWLTAQLTYKGIASLYAFTTMKP